MDSKAKAFVLEPDLRSARKALIEELGGAPEQSPLLIERGDVAPFPAVQPEQANAAHRNELAKLG
jgi:hypothetical protein